MTIDIQATQLCLADFVAVHAAARPHALALALGEEQLDWQALNKRVDGAAATLQQLGVGTGDPVAFFVPNSIPAYVAMLGALRIGAVISPLSSLFTADTLARITQDTGASVMVTDGSYSDRAAAAVAMVDTTNPCRLVQAEAMSQGAPSPLRAVQADAPATLIYSSGTTGMPKGILHTHRARVWMATICALAFSVTPYSRIMLTTPPHTNGSWMMVLPALLSGAATVLSDGFSVEAVLALFEDYGPTHAFLVPTQLGLLMANEQFRCPDTMPLQTIVSAGAPLPGPLKNDLLEQFPGVLRELWGLTEGVGTIATCIDSSLQRGSVGHALPGCELRIVDENGVDVTGKAVGEIVGRSPFVMSGYWRREEATRELAWSDATGRVFMRTGDLGEIDDDGRLFLRGRNKDLIISGGINVYPIDIETRLREHPDVGDVCVLGVPDSKWGETPVAVVIPREGASSGRESLMDWYNGGADKHLRLSRLLFRSEDFPRNTLGKVLKADLLADLAGSA